MRMYTKVLFARECQQRKVAISYLGVREVLRLVSFLCTSWAQIIPLNGKYILPVPCEYGVQGFYACTVSVTY